MGTRSITPETRTTDAAVRRGLSKKVRALLAGGLVLGLGATVTLAAWNDSEFATGTFTAGRFNLEGSADNTTWGSHASDGPASLAFQLAPDNLSPNTTVYAPFAVRLDMNTTSNASVAITSKKTTTAGVVTNLTYSLVKTDTFGCSSSSTGTTLVAAGTAVTSVGGVATFDLAKAATLGATGSPTFLCFAVTAGAIEQGQTGGVTWEFAATSKS